MGSYSVAIIGCGRIGGDCGPPGIGSSRLESHAAAYKAWEGAHLVAGCDRDERTRRRFGEKWGVTRLYADHREMLKREKVELVSVCTPASNHVEILLKLLQCKTVRGILLEKPVAPDIPAATKMIEAAKVSSAAVAVNYGRRYSSSYLEVRDMVRSGLLGRIQHVRGLYTKGVVNNGTHFIDLLRFFFGEPDEVRVCCGASTDTGDLSPKVDHTAGSDPTLNFCLTFPDGFEAWGVGVDHRAYNVFDVDIVGTEGRVVFTDLGHCRLLYRLEETEERHGFRQLAREPEASDTDLARATSRAVENLIKSIECGRSPRCTLEDGRAALALSLELAELPANGTRLDRQVPTAETV